MRGAKIGKSVSRIIDWPQHGGQWTARTARTWEKPSVSKFFGRHLNRLKTYKFCCLGLEKNMEICWAELSTGAWTQIWAYLTIPQLSPTTVETMARSREVPREAMKAKADEPDQLNIMYHVIIMIVEIKASDNQLGGYEFESFSSWIYIVPVPIPFQTTRAIHMNCG